MSLGHGVTISDSGLILQLDAANVKSYPGAGLIMNDLSKTSPTASFSQLSIINSYIDFNASSASTITFPEISKNNWTIIYSARPTGTPISNYRGILRIRDVSGNSFFFSDTREIATPNVLHYIKDFNLNSWWTRQMLSLTDYANFPWKIYACSLNGTQIKNYKNGDLLYTDTITQDLTGYGNLNRLDLSPSGNHVVNMGFVLLYNRTLADSEIKQNFEALRGRYGI
jgi:hypothetical protein